MGEGYRDLCMELTFEWDPSKSRKNLKDHDVSFSEATTVFNDESGITIFDPDHSDSEDRFIIFGRSAINRFLLVVHLDIDDSIRIISARELTRNERLIHEKEIIRRQGM
jgi:uncharacterized DUF497 family protein